LEKTKGSNVQEEGKPVERVERSTERNTEHKREYRNTGNRQNTSRPPYVKRERVLKKAT
jgi:hypothetical protein